MKLSKYIKRVAKGKQEPGCSVAMAAKYLELSKPTIVKKCNEKLLGSFSVAGEKMVSIPSLHNYIEQENARMAELVKKGRRILERAAAEGKSSLSYSDDFMKPLGLDHRNPRDRKTNALVLGGISGQTTREHKFMLSALVHYRGTSWPGDDFFIEAANLEYDFDDDEEFLKDQIDTIIAFYASQTSKR